MSMEKNEQLNAVEHQRPWTSSKPLRLSKDEVK